MNSFNSEKQEEYDSEPSTTSSESESEDYGSGPDAERKREEKRKQKAEKKAERERKKEKSGEPKEKRVKKKKMTKLPGQPKKNQTAYFLWMNENREKIKKDYPGLGMTDMSKKAGEIWKELENKSVRINNFVPVFIPRNVGLCFQLSHSVLGSV